MYSVESVRSAPAASRRDNAAAWATAALTCFGVSVCTALVLHVVLGAEVHPVRQVISDYGLYGAAGFAACVLTLAAGTGCLLVGMARAGLPVTRPIVALVCCWCAGLALCAFFPTTPTGAPWTFSAEIHRYAGLMLFVSLPAAAGLVAGRAANHPSYRGLAKRMRRHIRWAWGALAAFLLSHVPVFLTSSGEGENVQGPLFHGLTERLLFVVYLVLLGELTLAVLRSERKPC